MRGIHFSSADSSIEDRPTDTGEADGAEPSRRTIFNAPVAQCIERRASNAEVAGEIPAGSTTFPRLAQSEEAPALEAGQCGCKSCHGDFRFAPVAQLAEAAGLNPVQCRCKSDREHEFHARVVQRRDIRLKSGPVQVQVLPWAPIWNVNRTSEPGFFAKEIVAHFA